MSKDPRPRRKSNSGGAAFFVTFFICLVLWGIVMQVDEWAPTVAERWRAEVLRNYGLVVAAVIAFGVALWRGLLTEDQINLAWEQFEATREENRAAQDRDTFREAAKLLADPNDAIGTAGVQLLIDLSDGSSMAESARRLLKGHFDSRPKLRGSNVRDQLLVDWISENEDLFFTNRVFEGITISGSRRSSGWCAPSFKNCELKDTTIRANDGNNNRYEVEIGDSRIGGYFKSKTDVVMRNCSVDITLLQLEGRAKLEYCLVYELADTLGNDEIFITRASAESGQIVLENSAVIANPKLVAALGAGGNHKIQVISGQDAVDGMYDEDHFFGPNATIGLDYATRKRVEADEE